MNGMTAWVRRAARMSRRDWSTVLLVLWWYARVHVAMRRRGFTETIQRLGLVPSPGTDSVRGATPLLTAPVRRALRVSTRLLRLGVLRVSCLPRALVLHRVLLRAGLRPEVVVGVGHSETGAFQAHAWVELNGYVFEAAEAGASAWKPIGRFRSPEAGATVSADAGQRQDAL